MTSAWLRKRMSWLGNHVPIEHAAEHMHAPTGLGRLTAADILALLGTCEYGMKAGRLSSVDSRPPLLASAIFTRTTSRSWRSRHNEHNARGKPLNHPKHCPLGKYVHRLAFLAQQRLHSRQTVQYCWVCMSWKNDARRNLKPIQPTPIGKGVYATLLGSAAPATGFRGLQRALHTHARVHLHVRLPPCSPQ